jgi:hypothetical protein
VYVSLSMTNWKCSTSLLKYTSKQERIVKVEELEFSLSSFPQRSRPVLEGVSCLLDKSLLLQSGQGDEPRVLLLETIREYAL